MLDANQVRKLIEERSNLHMNDPKMYEYWDWLTELLSINVSDTIKFLNSCSEREIYWISEIFEDISAKVSSIDYIECLKELDKKFPNLMLSNVIKIAEDWM
ncbi:hypothetical protein [Gottfriedia solisilvae]|uniref:Uncharacterized protein n=1 Tax=Gottfriedia solisilvae TaxID=1516104 RepID=A0A8J3F235_9BACI|nr:hypothetical protein [Gottfriedia solisilvae]GGI17977.1 hypothetical protein GCM10007380_40630 [Gottfriedia solisilvae]